MSLPKDFKQLIRLWQILYIPQLLYVLYLGFLYLTQNEFGVIPGIDALLGIVILTSLGLTLWILWFLQQIATGESKNGTLLKILAILLLFGFPLGTILGVLVLKKLSQPEVRKHFRW